MKSIWLRNKFLSNPNLKPAAVLIPLVIKPGAQEIELSSPRSTVSISTASEVILTVRSHTVEHHKGQISFPGGMFEPHDDTLENTALRETFEEIGLNPQQVEIIAELPEIPTVATQFRVTPFVGLIREAPMLTPNHEEIGEILHVPLAHLLDPTNSALESYDRQGLTYKMRAYQYGSHRIWGATGLMLQILIEKFLAKPQG